MPKCEGCGNSTRTRDLKTVQVGEDEDLLLCPKCRKVRAVEENEEPEVSGASVFNIFQGGKGKAILRNKFSYRYDGDGYAIIIELNEKGGAVIVSAGPFDFKVSTKWKALNHLIQGSLGAK